MAYQSVSIPVLRSGIICPACNNSDWLFIGVVIGIWISLMVFLVYRAYKRNKQRNDPLWLESEVDL